MDPRALDPVIHQPVRLRIMIVLYRNRRASAGDLRRRLGLTPGNLGSHVAKLEEVGHIKSGRLFVGLTFEVHYAITEAGSAAFRRYLEDLHALLDQTGAGRRATHGDSMDGERAPGSEVSRSWAPANGPAGRDGVADGEAGPRSATQKGEPGNESVGRGGAMDALSERTAAGGRWT